ncbi:MAG: hypothetical protein QGG42_07635 [Phycisphaerae bacterium]|jgi:Ca2+-binding EF-hand superfamily protein|nr:hypothetical protein [Phycisphaerae bacterium]
MKQLTAIILVVLVVGGISLGQAKSAKPADKPAPDICKGVIDPYDISGEKALFYAAAGVDNELTSTEFEAARGKKKSFVRKFDSWKILITFDKDKNGKIDWNEAGEYRQETRRKVMGSFDKNKDGKLSGDERTAANKALSAGRLSLGSISAAREARRAQWRAEMLAKYDTDKDGKLNEKEEAARRKAYEQARREREERFRQERELREHDADRDGKLNDKESAARDKDRADRERRKAEFMKKYDTNGDGRITGEEWKEAGPALREAIRKYTTDKFDKNKDGELDEGEKAAMQKEMERRRNEGRARMEMYRYDKNKDGKLDEAETAARDKGRAEWAKRMAEYVKKYDKNGDGKVDDKERPSRGSGGRGRSRGGRGGSSRGGPPHGGSRRDESRER